jgi:heparin/heparan-sulfate lyase
VSVARRTEVARSHDLLTAAEKQAFIKELVRLAKTQGCGYPPTRQGSVTGHASEAMIMGDMLSAGIAIYDEFPEMYGLAVGRFFREHLPVRNWLYNGHAYHQGDSYGAHRFSWDTYPLWIFDRLGAGNVYNPEQRFVPYLWIYVTRPDGQRLRAGDTFAHSTPRGRPWSEYMGTLLTASYYGDGVLLEQFQRQGSASGNETLFEVLWRNLELQLKSISTLPLSRYFGSPFGWMIARTGCVIEGQGVSWIVLLRRDSARSANPVEFTVTGAGRTRVLITDLVPGRWQVRRAGSAETRFLDVEEDAGTAWFEATAGTWTLSRT